MRRNRLLDAKRQILEAAAELLETRSFTAFSYGDLAQRLGVTKASIHYHFPSKDDLGVALAEHYHRKYEDTLADIDETYQRPSERVAAYLLISSDVVDSSDRICPAGAVQCEHNVVPAGMSRGVHRLVDLHRTWLARVLDEGREAGEMDFPGRAEDQAVLIVAAMQGALQNARAEGPEFFQAVAGQILRSIGLSTASVG